MNKFYRKIKRIFIKPKSPQELYELYLKGMKEIDRGNTGYMSAEDFNKAISNAQSEFIKNLRNKST